MNFALEKLVQDKKVFYMKRLVAICHGCRWHEERMVNPRNTKEIQEIRRQMRAAHANSIQPDKTTCPFDVTII